LRACADTKSSQLANEVRETMNMKINQVKGEREESKKHTHIIEQQLEEVFKTLLDSA
jgi:hypothetical protein